MQEIFNTVLDKSFQNLYEIANDFACKWIVTLKSRVILNKKPLLHDVLSCIFNSLSTCMN